MTSLRFLAALGFTLALAGSPLAAGCGGATAESFCNRQCDCQPCTDTQYKECVLEVNEFVQRAARKGCGDVAGDYVTCLEDNLLCNNGLLDEDQADRVCKPLLGALHDCV